MDKKVTITVDNFSAYNICFLAMLKEKINKNKDLPFYVSYDIHDISERHSIMNMDFIPKNEDLLNNPPTIYKKQKLDREDIVG